MKNNFFALINRMKYINRWALMRNTREESLSEHSMEVAIIAHALCVIANERYGRNLDAYKAAVVGLYHDASEIITGDMPTPIKYVNDTLKKAYKDVERSAEDKLLDSIAADLAPYYGKVFYFDEADKNEIYMRKLVKAADKLSALIKCRSEVDAGNHEFITAKESTEKAVRLLYSELPEVLDFVNEYLPLYGNTLDELLM